LGIGELIMGCCGKKIKKVKTIIKGTTSLVIETVTGLEVMKSSLYDKRYKLCEQCSFQTWFTGPEYCCWLINNGIEVTCNLEDLTALPLLPKFVSHHYNELYCQLCKCRIKGKARVEDEECPKGKW
jgi:hypothetical protein